MPTEYILRGIGPPYPKQKEIEDFILRPDPNQVKQVNVCCGLGFGKTTLGIYLACKTMSLDPNAYGLFLEPDWRRVNSIFLAEWLRIVPPELYTLNKTKRLITWVNGAHLEYGPRNITGDKITSRRMYNGLNLTFVIDDETAIGYDHEQHTNILARIRVKSDYMYFLTESTPLVGSYGRLLETPGQKLFRGRTKDNIYLPPHVEPTLRKNMSSQQARRELDGEMIALEGRIWKEADIHTAWPNGNRHDQFAEFRANEPFYLLCDLGSATGAYVIVQKTAPTLYGRVIFSPGPVWVAVADLCPVDDASAVRAFRLIDKHFGRPKAIVAGADVGTRDDVSGETADFVAKQVWPNVHIMPCDERAYNKRVQFDELTYLMCSVGGERRFTVAKNFKSLDEDSHRGVREMIEQDQMPPIEKRRESDFLPKGKDHIVQHVRDACLMGAAMLMGDPQWIHRVKRSKAA